MQKPQRKLELASMYLSQRVLGGHWIALSLKPTGHGHMSGKVQIDPNSCSLNMWGDRQVCTRIAISAHDVEATLMRTLDPQGHHRVHWTLDVKGLTDAKISLIENPRAKLWYLAVESEQEGISIVPLFDAELFAAAGKEAARAG